MLASGDRFEGHFADDKKEGPGRYYYINTGKVRISASFHIVFCCHASILPSVDTT